MSSTSEVYERAGFGAPVVRGSRPALLVVDFTHGFTDPTFPTGADMTDAVLATERLVSTAHRHAVPVVFTTIAFSTPLEGRAWRQKAPGLGALRAGTLAVEIDARLNRRPTDVVVVKHGASAFFGTGLSALLAGAGADTLVVCGATTSGCVRASVVDAVQSGYAVLVPRECVADRAQGPHDANLFDMQAKYADVVTLEDADAYLAAREEAGPVDARPPREKPTGAPAIPGVTK